MMKLASIFFWLGICIGRRKTIHNEAPNRSLFLFCNYHAIGFVPQEKGACIPRTLVFGALLLQYVQAIIFEVNEHIVFVLHAAIDVSRSHLLIVRDTDQVKALATKTRNLMKNLPSFQGNVKIDARHRGHDDLVHIILEYLRDRLIIKIAPDRILLRDLILRRG